MNVFIIAGRKHTASGLFLKRSHDPTAYEIWTAYLMLQLNMWAENSAVQVLSATT